MNITKIMASSALALAISANAMASTKQENTFNYVVERFADIEVLRYKVPGFEELSLNQKKLVYYLSQAAIYGRDILWSQNNRYNLELRQLLEAIYTSYEGSREDAQFKAFEVYLKQVWFGNGIHHHYSMDKFTPTFDRSFIEAQIKTLPAEKIPANLDDLNLSLWLKR